LNKPILNDLNVVNLHRPSRQIGPRVHVKNNLMKFSLH